jgi:hypothetical protein
MLNEKSRAVLSSLLKINNSVIHTYPVTGVRSGKNIFAFFDVSKHGEEDFEEYSTFDTTEMLSLVSLLDKPSISLDGRVMTIKNDKNKIVYMTAKTLMLEDTSRVDPTLITRMKANEVLAEFELTQKEIESTIKTSSLLKGLENFVIKVSGDQAVVEVRGDEKSSNSFEIHTPAKVAVETEFTLSMPNVAKIPSGDYSVTLNRNPKGTIVAIFSHKTIEGLDVVISGKAEK